LNKLNSELKELNENREIKQKRLDDLTAEANVMIRKLNAATKLITGLGREN